MKITSTTPAPTATYAAFLEPDGTTAIESVSVLATTDAGTTLVVTAGALAALGADLSPLLERQPTWWGLANDPEDARAQATA